MTTTSATEGLRLLLSGRAAEALPLLAEACRLDPGDDEALLGHAFALLENRRVDAAVPLFRKVLSRRPQDPQAHANLARALAASGAIEEATACWRRASTLAPGNVDYATSLATLLRETGRPEEACAVLERHVAAQPGHAGARWELARSLWAADRMDESQRQFEAHHALQPGNARSLVALGRLAASRGDVVAARGFLRRALELAPQDAAAWWEYAHADPDAIDANAAAIVARLAQESPHPMQRELFEDILARHHDRAGRHREAMVHASMANRLHRDGDRARGMAYDPAMHAREVDALCSTYVRGLCDANRGAGDPSAKPVFIIGLPRSGTTLLERMLAGHPRVCGIGEQMLARQSLLRAFSAGATTEVARLPPSLVADAAKWHLAELDRRARMHPSRRDAARVVDKLPENYLLAGWLAMTLPHATIIHCQRDPRDVAVSCWLARFGELPWSFEIGHIAARIAQHRRLMRHWRHVLPGRLVEVSYEDLVADPQATLRGLLQRMGLEWDEAVLDFDRNEGVVKSASQLQVRQPLNARGIGRWQAYASVLEPVMHQLEAIVAGDRTERSLVFAQPIAG